LYNSLPRYGGQGTAVLITVHVEWPTGHEDVEFEMDDSATPEEIAEAAESAFFDVCNFGYSINGEQA
jgi:hypothetical protein